MPLLTLEQFKEKAIKIHGNKYDYSETKYIHGRQPMKIYCNTCKCFFEQTGNNHLCGKGCRTCGYKNKISEETLIEKFQKFLIDAQIIHGDKYDYKNFKYVTSNTKGKIHCNQCNNDFEQSPQLHIGRKAGCRNCANKINGNNQRKTLNQFIHDAMVIHGNKYDYSEFIYISAQIKGIIICNRCGKRFEQSPTNHLQNHGCMDCAHIDIANGQRKTLVKFIQDAILIHGNKYEYDKFVYVNSHIPGEIYCKKCKNIFMCSPGNHLQPNRNCTFCALSFMEMKVADILEELKNEIFSWKIEEITANRQSLVGCNLKPDFFIKMHMKNDNKTQTTTMVVIEMDGVFHFEAIPISKRLDPMQQLQSQQKRDKQKNQYCLDQKINLLRIDDTINHVEYRNHIKMFFDDMVNNKLNKPLLRRIGTRYVNLPAY